MSISTRDRKLLWARAGGICSICKHHLTADAQGKDRDVILGEEAHIVSEELNGPRYRPMPKNEVDLYANLILLCLPDHKIIDEQVTSHTEQRLIALKREHEQWVKDKISPAIPTIKIRDPEADRPIILKRVETGKVLMNMVGHTVAAYHDNPEPRSVEEAELIGAFFQNVSDYMEIWDDIKPSRRIQATFFISEEITRLREAGLVVYAGSRQHVIEGGVKAPEPWPVAWIVIYRNDDEAI